MQIADPDNLARPNYISTAAGDTDHQHPRRTERWLSYRVGFDLDTLCPVYGYMVLQFAAVVRHPAISPKQVNQTIGTTVQHTTEHTPSHYSSIRFASQRVH